MAPPRLSAALLDTLRDRFGFAGASATAVRELIVDRDDLRGSLSVIGVLLVLGSATSFTRALQKVYERAWGLPKLGMRGLWRGAAWVAGLIGYLALLTLAVRVSRSRHIGGTLGAFTASTARWDAPSAAPRTRTAGAANPRPARRSPGCRRPSGGARGSRRRRSPRARPPPARAPP
jgi:hypothetical protein